MGYVTHPCVTPSNCEGTYMHALPRVTGAAVLIMTSALCGGLVCPPADLIRICSDSLPPKMSCSLPSCLINF